jgi:hypothetical protein
VTYTPRNINDIFPLKKDEILVFGSNTEGRHGKGLAKLALNRAGAKYGQSRGLQGRAYAIVTKDLRLGERSIPLTSIQEEIKELYEFAKNQTHLKFWVSLIGCSLAGYEVNEIAALFHMLESERPPNIRLPIEFTP